MTYMSLSQRIQLEQGKLKPSEVVELHLDHAKATDIEGLTSDYSSLELLSLSTVGLEKLGGLPELPSLKMLDLSSNSLTGGLEDLLRCPNLEQLNLSSNKIESIDLLSPLAKLSALKKLDLFDCGVANTENYRKKVFALIPNLVYLDGLDQNDNEEPSDQLTNGEEEDEADENGAGDEDDEEDSEDEEEYGIEALQRSGDLEDDDEEDYAPGEDEENEVDDYDDIDDDEDDVDEEDDGANLSGAGVTGPRRPAAKRRHDAGEGSEDGPLAKHKATSEGGKDKASVNNGSAAENQP